MTQERTRTRSDMLFGTQTHNSTGKVEKRSSTISQETTVDYIDSGDNQPFRSHNFLCQGGILQGRTYGQFGYTYDAWPSDWQRSGSKRYAKLPVDVPNGGTLASTALKRTNPSRASIDAIVSGLELRELPELVKQTFSDGKDGLFRHLPESKFKALGRVGKINLMIQFGLLPMIGDLEKLLVFQRLVDGRVREFKRLQERGLRRTVDLGSYSSSKTDRNVFLNSYGGTVKGDLHTHTSVNIRGHVRWRVDNNFIESDAALRTLARNVISNWRLDPLALYELMPWSWLLDYFTNLGDFVSLTRNVIGARYENPRIIKHYVTRISSSNETKLSGNAKFIPINNVGEEKYRDIVPAQLDAHFGFLTGNQMSILGSLAVSKGRL